MAGSLKEKLPPWTRSFLRGVRQTYIGATDWATLVTSRSLDITGCKSVCLALGPYRNLTTLTAATLFLHPNCQVLNHAGARVFGKDKIDFLATYSEERLDRFIQFATKISAGGRKGSIGGSITRSHAFAYHPEMRKLYRDSKLSLTKPQIKCLFWKEPLLTSNWIRSQQTDIGGMLTQEKRLRFLFPIRFPLDCAISNLKTDHARHFQGLRSGASTADVATAILDELLWFARYQQQFPDRFFTFFAHELSRDLLFRLADFLDLEAEESWLSSASSVCVKPSGYQHEAELVAWYRETVQQRFADFPQLTAGLLYFA